MRKVGTIALLFETTYDRLANVGEPHNGVPVLELMVLGCANVANGNSQALAWENR